MKNLESTFVIVSQDASLIESVRASVGSLATLQVVPDLADALSLVRTPPALGVIVDGAALRGQAVSQLTRLRTAGPLVSILFIASELRAGLLNDIQPLRIELLVR